MTTRNQLTTIEKSFEIVFALQELEGATLAELTDQLELPKSTIHRHLSTLAEYGFVHVDERTYSVGLRFLELGEYARTQNKAYQLAESPVRQLAQRTNERAQFVVEEHGEGVYIQVAVGEHAVRTGLRIGNRIPLHSTAAGKVILAYLESERVDDILAEHGLPAYTDATITDRDILYSQLNEIRERGYAFNNKENIPGLRAVAGPVTDANRHLIGVLSVSGPSNRMKGEWFEDEIPDLILGAANELELRIAYA